METVYVVTINSQVSVFRREADAMAELESTLRYNRDDPAEVLRRLRADGYDAGKDWQVDRAEVR